MLQNLTNRSAKLRRFIHKKLRQSTRISRKTLELSCLLTGAALVALASLTFAAIADYALDANRSWAGACPPAAWFILPPGLALLAWFTQKHAPYVAGSGIPQVIAALSLPYSADKTRLIAWPHTLWKIPLTFLAMLIGASVGREGPSVQVGAAVMLAWGNYCRRHRLAFSGLSANELIATGAAGGLAAAFNAPLAGIIFAIEELGRGLHLRWECRLLLGVLAAGFILIAIKGNNPYFPRLQRRYHHTAHPPLDSTLRPRLRHLRRHLRPPARQRRTRLRPRRPARLALPPPRRLPPRRHRPAHRRPNLRHRLPQRRPGAGRRNPPAAPLRHRQTPRHRRHLLERHQANGIQ